MMKYASKYKIIRLKNGMSLLVFDKLIKGEVVNLDYFESENEIYTYINNPILDGKYVIADAISIEDLRYDYGENIHDNKHDGDILKFYSEQCADMISIVDNGVRKQWSLYQAFDDKDDEKTLYQMANGESALFFNEKIFEILVDCDDIDILKDVLLSYKDRLVDFESKYHRNGFSSIYVENGHVVNVELDNKISYVKDAKVSVRGEIKENVAPSDYSIHGLYEYLRQRIIGHDVELKKIAAILYLNFKSNREYGTKSILIPGPTGTGKTATFRAVADYFNVPFAEVNTANLVPQGIVGESIEDVFEELIDSCNGDILMAERAIIVFDEFDKISSDNSENKVGLANIFLKALEGSKFAITSQYKNTQLFDTTMSSKICLGAFNEAYVHDKKLGFGSITEEEAKFDRELLVKKGYFSRELLDRLSFFIPYKELSNDDKKRIILESKLSEYLKIKKRLQQEYGVEVTGDEEFANGVISSLNQSDRSVRDINNIINETLLEPMCEIDESDGKYKILRLFNDTVSKNNYDLK